MRSKHWKVRSPVTALILALAVGLAACGSDSPSSPGNGTPPPGGNGTGNGGPDENEVHVDDNFFNPASLTVAPGTTVTWTWVGGIEHNVVWQEADLPNGPLQSSGTHEVTMPAVAGTYAYTCEIHPGMDGTVIVEEEEEEED